MTRALSLPRLLLACLFILSFPASIEAQPSEISPEARAAWGFDRSDLTPDPGIRFGVLPNGMRYALMRNEVSAGALSVRLHLDGGAMVEGKDELGQMHVIEHLIFHGSDHVPEGTLPRLLAKVGLNEWSDFSAFTTYDETVFQLDLGQADGEARATALMVMRDIADGLRFTTEAVAGAKTKVREEIRARNAVADRIATAQNAFFMPGTPIARGPVAGTEKDVKRVGAAALRRLHDLHYVPRRATLVIVGDVDPAIAEEEIVSRFGDWRPNGPAEPPPSPPAILAERGTEIQILIDPAAATIVTIASVRPVGGTDATSPRNAAFLEHLGSRMLERRLARAAAETGIPFRSVDAAIYDHFSTARLAEIEVEAADGDWRRALSTSGLELRRALEEGFTQGELDAELASRRNAAPGPTAPRTSTDLADAIVDAVGRDIVFTAPAEPAASAAYFAGIRLDDVNAAFGSAWARPERLIFIAHHEAIPGGTNGIARIWADDMNKALAAGSR